MQMDLPTGRERGEGLAKAWKIYVKYYGYDIRVPGSFKTEEDAMLFYRRNKDAFKQKDGNYGEPIYVKTGKGKD